MINCWQLYFHFHFISTSTVHTHILGNPFLLLCHHFCFLPFGCHSIQLEHSKLYTSLLLLLKLNWIIGTYYAFKVSLLFYLYLFCICFALFLSPKRLRLGRSNLLSYSFTTQCCPLINSAPEPLFSGYSVAVAMAAIPQRQPSRSDTAALFSAGFQHRKVLASKRKQRR